MTCRYYITFHNFQVITFERDVVLKNACVIPLYIFFSKSVVNDTSHHELYLAFKKLQLSWRKRPQAETLKLEHSPSTVYYCWIFSSILHEDHTTKFNQLSALLDTNRRKTLRC